MPEPNTTTLLAITGSVTAVLKVLSRRSRLSAWIRRRQDEDKARDEAFMELLVLIGKHVNLDEAAVAAIRGRLAARLEAVAMVHQRRSLLDRWRRKS